MADLFDQLFVRSNAYEKIGVHTIHAALVDYAEGESTRTQIKNGLNMETDAQTDFDALCDAIDGETGIVNKHRWATNFHAVGLIAETELKYTTKSAFKTRLGL